MGVPAVERRSGIALRRMEPVRRGRRFGAGTIHFEAVVGTEACTCGTLVITTSITAI